MDRQGERRGGTWIARLSARRDTVPRRGVLGGLLFVGTALILAGCGLTQGATKQPPPGKGQLSANPPSVSFGNIPVGASSNQGVLLTNNGSVSTNISQVNVSGAGLSTSGLTAPMSLTAGQSTLITITFAPTSAVTTTGNVTLVSDAANSPMTVAVSGTGVQGHSVALTWNPSTSSVLGYNVYRSTQASGPFSIVNSSLVLATSFTDFSVASGNTYFYVTTAVDSSGVESTFSNSVSATIP